MSSIMLHPSHGLAPAITTCPVCGEDVGIALLGNKCHSVMKKVYEATGGQYGNKDGYSEYGHNKIPDQGICNGCKELLDNGGVIIVAKDIGQSLRLDKEMADGLVGRVGGEVNGEIKVIDINAMRGKVYHMAKAFWVVDPEGKVLMRDPKEWLE